MKSSQTSSIEEWKQICQEAWQDIHQTLVPKLAHALHHLEAVTKPILTNDNKYRRGASTATLYLW